MRIVLVNPPQTFYEKSRSPSAGIPLGLLYIAGSLDRSADDVTLIDCLMEDPRHTVNNDGSVTIGMTIDRIRKRVREIQPDIVGITCPYTPQIPNVYLVARAIKSEDERIITVLGGPHATVRPVGVLEECRDIDIVVTGEGEYTFREVVEKIRTGGGMAGITGIVFRNGEDVVVNEPRPFIEPLDMIPCPAYDLIDMETYFRSKLRSRASFHDREISMITSRGCPFNCVFCSIHLHMGKKWRGHSARYVLDHISYLVSTYRINHIHFEDDNLTFDKGRFESILDGLIGLGTDITWDTPNGVRADHLDFNLIKKMKQAGCTGLTIGIESGVQKTLDKIIHKKLRLEKVIEVAGFCKSVNLPLNGFFIIGFPGETKQDMQKTIDFALALKKDYNVNMELFVATPFFGTDLYNQCMDGGYFTQEISPKALAVAVQYWGTGLIMTPDFTADDIRKISESAASRYAKAALMDYFRNPGYAIRMAFTHPRDAIRFLGNVFNIRQKNG